ncbi:hypothetical protein [Intrasporangium sp.]|uniref:hypothetical protein n=1 Tax=Intrasporangium sp. TaxID=1925024 RepID=UPI003365AC5B
MTDQPKTRRERRELERRHGPGVAVALTIVALLVLGAAVWFGKDLFLGSPTAGPAAVGNTSTPTATATTTTSPEPTASEPSPTTVDPVAAQVENCRNGWQLQAAATNAAATVLAEWDAHLDIMNNLQAGKTTLAQAKKDWGPTTANAPAHIAAFHAADQAFTSSKLRCVKPAAAADGAAAALATCAANMQVVDGVLAKARTAIEPWETHLKDQSHFKAGGITAAKAEALWRSLWQKGLRLNPPYFAAAKSGAKATCSLPG